MLKFLLLVALFAAAIYLTVRLVQHRGLPKRRLPRAAPPRPVGPDDDPDFLWDLDKKRRHPEDPDSKDG